MSIVCMVSVSQVQTYSSGKVGNWSGFAAISDSEHGDVGLVGDWGGEVHGDVGLVGDWEGDE